MKLTYSRLGGYIEPCNEKNSESKISDSMLRGISNQKYFQKAKTNTIGVDLSKYRIVRKGQFAFNRATTRNGDKISIALREGKDCIVSPSYRIFKSKDENILNSEYLMMWFKRPEFDRYARYKSHGSAHEFFDYDEMCEVELPIPSIEKQRAIVKEYNTVVNRIQLNQQLNQRLEETAQALYKHWFVDFEFPFDFAQGKPNMQGKPYKSSGGKMVYNEELDKDIPEGWELGCLADYICFSTKRIKVEDLSLKTYVSTDNMLADKKGIEKANKLPTVKSVTKFDDGDILISNIRPYLKKIWQASYSGGASNDVLCLTPNSTNLSSYIYTILENDSFFEYVMLGAKGTKMPRGDKDWIMNFRLIKPNPTIINFFSKINNTFLKYKNDKAMEATLILSTTNILLSKMTKVDSEKEI